MTQGRYSRADRVRIAHLFEPYEDAFLRHVARDSAVSTSSNHLWRSFRLCARAMLDLDCAYWAFTWERLLAWRAEQERQHADRSPGWRQGWHTCWTAVTATLFFLEVLPYHEQIYRANHMELAYKWLGREVALAIQERFVDMGKAIGYRHGRQLMSRGAAVVLTVLTAKRSTDVASITRADLEDWLARTRRSRRVASQGVTMAEKVLAAMGYLGGAAPRATDHRATRATWGRTAPAIVDTMERFLADIRPTRRPRTVSTYEVVLRRFGDWLGLHDPTVCSVADIRRPHVEAYKRAVAEMKIGDHVSPLRGHNVLKSAKRGQPISRSHQVRCVSCVKAFFDTIEALDYPERPGRPLFVRGDVQRVDHELPRFIPDPAWHRILGVVRGLTPELVEQHDLPRPHERSAAVAGLLTECGLRAGELCRLDTGCVIAAQDAATGAVTHWLRVPVGKLRNDRMIPIRAALVETLDAWMRRRGPQPMHRDERTGAMRDFLLTWRGTPLSPWHLNEFIAKVCALAAVPRTTSHPFRHTLAVQWRRNGMKIETISRMLGHTSLQMTMRYAAVMPETLRRECDAAFAALDDEHRLTAQVRVVLSPAAHAAAASAWRESMWVDLGVGWCGLSAYLPCGNRLACLPCPHFIEKREQLPLLREQRSNLLELRMLGAEVLPADRRDELAAAAETLDRRIVALEDAPSTRPDAAFGDQAAMGEPDARSDHHARRRDRGGARGGAGPPADGRP
jgi:integrase